MLHDPARRRPALEEVFALSQKEFKVLFQSAAASLFPPMYNDYEDGEESPAPELRWDDSTNRVEAGAPQCGRQVSFMTESVRRQISVLFDEPDSPQHRSDPVLPEAWALNWASPLGNSMVARAA